MIRVITQGLSGELDIAMNYEQQIKFLSFMRNKLGSLTAGCVGREREENINLSSIIDDTIQLFTREIFDLALIVKVNIHRSIKDLKCDELFLRQVFVSLLSETIVCCKQKGEIKINAYIEKTDLLKNLILEIKDNGFGVLKRSRMDVTNSECISLLALNSNDLKSLIESYGGLLEVTSIIGQSKTIAFSIPCGNNDLTPATGDNVVRLFAKT